MPTGVKPNGPELVPGTTVNAVAAFAPSTTRNTSRSLAETPAEKTSTPPTSARFDGSVTPAGSAMLATAPPAATRFSVVAKVTLSAAVKYTASPTTVSCDGFVAAPPVTMWVPAGVPSVTHRLPVDPSYAVKYTRSPWRTEAVVAVNPRLAPPSMVNASRSSSVDVNTRWSPTSATVIACAGSPAAVRASWRRAAMSATRSAADALSTVCGSDAERNPTTTGTATSEPSARVTRSVNVSGMSGRPSVGAACAAATDVRLADVTSASKPIAVAPAIRRRTTSSPAEVLAATSARRSPRTTNETDPVWNPAAESRVSSAWLRSTASPVRFVLPAVALAATVTDRSVVVPPSRVSEIPNARSAVWPLAGPAAVASIATSCAEGTDAPKPTGFAPTARIRTMASSAAVNDSRPVAPSRATVTSVVSKPAPASAPSSSVAIWERSSARLVLKRDSENGTSIDSVVSAPSSVTSSSANRKSATGCPSDGSVPSAWSTADPVTARKSQAEPATSVTLTVPAVVPSVFQSSTPEKLLFAVK